MCHCNISWVRAKLLLLSKSYLSPRECLSVRLSFCLCYAVTGSHSLSRSIFISFFLPPLSPPSGIAGVEEEDHSNVGRSAARRRRLAKAARLSPSSALSFGHPHCEYIRQFRSGGEGATRGVETEGGQLRLDEGRKAGKREGIADGSLSFASHS